MNTHILSNKSRIYGISISIIFHLIVGIIFYYVHMHKRVIIPEFAEMVMPSGYVQPVTGEYEDAAAASSEKIKNMLPENIELPEKMELKEDDRLNHSQQRKNVEDLKPVIPSRQKIETPVLKSGKIIQEEPVFTEKRSADFGFSKPTLKPADELSGAGTDVEKVYSIEWEGDFKREILYEKLPDISNINAQEAEIKLIFFVEADG
ncbi:MAG: hypothetical protein KAR38_17765, partial [Calditrichia bacterium]|nr:hypothetical protein [Calditrichia bacterium]